MIRPVISSGEVVAGRLVGDLGAAPQHDDAVADGEHVGHAVADQHDRDALRLEAPDQFQHLGHLPHRDRRRRLVHQHQLGVGKPGARDRHRLALAARHLPDQIARPRLRLELREQARRAVDHRLLVEHAERPEALLDLAAEKDVLRGGQIVGQRQVLIDDLDPLGARLDRLVEVADLAVDGDLALARREIAGDRA